MKRQPVGGVDARTLHHGADPVLAEARAQAAAHLAGWQRARADYENLRKRLDEERADAAVAASDALLKSLLPLVDYFDAAVAHLPEHLLNDAWAQGIVQIHQALKDFLRHAGVEPIDETAVPFDATRHEAVGEATSERPAGTILAVAACGYLRQGRVLRPAKVRVAAPAPARQLETATPEPVNLDLPYVQNPRH